MSLLLLLLTLLLLLLLLLQSGAEPAEKMIRELVACEHEYINTDHPDFIGGTRAVKVGGGFGVSVCQTTAW